MANENKQKVGLTNFVGTADSVNGFSNLKPAGELNKSFNGLNNLKPAAPQAPSNSTPNVAQGTVPVANQDTNKK